MEVLQQTCLSSHYNQLEKLLLDQALIKVALAHQMRPCNAIYVSTPNLQVLLSDAARSGNPFCIEILLDFANKNSIAYETLITRDTIFAALDGGNDAVFQEFIKAWPASVHLPLGHMGYPLRQALIKERFDLATYLLEHGADPNAVCGPHTGPGCYLRLSAQKLPLRYTKLLLQHDARIAQSGSIRMAAEKGRLDVLQALVEHGGDVNELLEPRVGFLTQKLKHQHASETPLFTATENGNLGIVVYLLEQGADAKIGDLNGKTPRMLATEKDDKELLSAFEKYSA